MLTLIAMLTLLITFTVMVLNLGTVARDTVQALQNVAANTRAGGRLWPSVAFGALWFMIFALSFG